MLPLNQVEFILRCGGSVGYQEGTDLIKRNARNGKLLRRAAIHGYVNVVKFFLEAKNRFQMTRKEAKKCTNRGAANPGGMTPLHFAAYHGFADVVEFVVASEGLKVLEGSSEITALYCASRQGHLDVVKLLISYEAFSLRQCKDAINIAGYKGHSEIAKCLFAANVPAGEAMCYAAAGGHEAIVRFFLEHNLCPDGQAIDKCFFEGDDMADLRLSKFFLEARFFVPSPLRPLRSPLFLSLQCNGRITLTRGMEMEESYKTALHLAAEGNHLPVVQTLLDSNADVNVKNRIGYTPLDVAVEKGSRHAATLLQSHGALLSKNGQSLKKAIENGRLLSLFCLQAMGADMNFFQKPELPLFEIDGAVPLHIASLKNQRAVVQYLLQCDVLVDARDVEANTPLLYACAGGHIEVVKLLITHGASVNAKNRRGEYPLTLSLIQGSTAVVKYLLDNDASPNVRCDGDDKTLPLLGCLMGYEKLARRFLKSEKNIIVLSSNMCNLTPLHRATMVNNISAAKLLIDFGAQVNAVNQDKGTPLHTVRSVAMAELLLKNKANPLIQNKKGLTPLQCAKLCVRNDILSVLERHVTA